ncbi:MAG: hypothetical protein K5649_09350 [Lachnospiraceae bacterium]|nr:hypothetical protein [Lachnospiraceae bacterium]
MAVAFFHGIHETSFFDVALVAALLLTLFSMMDHKWMMNLILGEFVVIMAMQVYMKHLSGASDFDVITIARILFHLAIVFATYVFCRITIQNRLESADRLEQDAEDIENYDKDMEDFLSNISHELRTPVNVVNGMSTLLMKKRMDGELRSIHDAGLRLSSQIEDIQDYTEIKRGDVLLEEENYMSTSLINDVVALTANVVSGAKEMFIREGFDGFIAKPIDIADFERVLKRVLPEELISYEENPKGGSL